MVAHRVFDEQEGEELSAPSQTALTWSSDRHWWANIAERLLLKKAGRRAMALQMGCVNHDPVGLRTLGSEGREDLVKHSEQAPSHEAIIPPINSKLFWPNCPDFKRL